MIILINNDVQIETFINWILIRWLQQKWSVHSEAVDNEISEVLHVHSSFVWVLIEWMMKTF